MRHFLGITQYTFKKEHCNKLNLKCTILMHMWPYLLLATPRPPYLGQGPPLFPTIKYCPLPLKEADLITKTFHVILFVLGKS